MTDINVYCGKPMIRTDGVEGWKYEITVYPIPSNHMKIAEVITDAIKALD